MDGYVSAQHVFCSVLVLVCYVGNDEREADVYSNRSSSPYVQVKVVSGLAHDLANAKARAQHVALWRILLKTPLRCLARACPHLFSAAL